MMLRGMLSCKLGLYLLIGLSHAKASREKYLDWHHQYRDTGGIFEKFGRYAYIEVSYYLELQSNLPKIRIK